MKIGRIDRRHAGKVERVEWAESRNVEVRVTGVADDGSE